jgi:hypothetical protein
MTARRSDHDRNFQQLRSCLDPMRSSNCQTWLWSRYFRSRGGRLDLSKWSFQILANPSCPWQSLRPACRRWQVGGWRWPRRAGPTPARLCNVSIIDPGIPQHDAMLWVFNHHGCPWHIDMPRREGNQRAFGTAEWADVHSTHSKTRHGSSLNFMMRSSCCVFSTGRKHAPPPASVVIRD